MRDATVTLTWGMDEVYPIDAHFARTDAVSIDAIRYVSPGPDGQYVQLFDLDGDLDRARALLADAPAVSEHDVVGGYGRGVAYAQCRRVGVVDDLLAALYDHEILVDWPIRYLDGPDRGLRLRVVGTSEAIQRAAAALPDVVELDLERVGQYDPDAGRLARVLTERQRELFDLAVAEGYYEVPRETTHRDLAARLDRSPGTVSEHLQRIESKLAATAADQLS